MQCSKVGLKNCVRRILALALFILCVSFFFLPAKCCLNLCLALLLFLPNIVCIPTQYSDLLFPLFTNRFIAGLQEMFTRGWYEMFTVYVGMFTEIVNKCLLMVGKKF